MKIQTLKALLAIKQLGSISAAAQQLHMTQPALSMAIRQLEEEVGAQLLVRTKQGASFTSFGQSFLNHAALIVSESRRAQEEIDQLRGQWEGEVRLSASAGIALSILPQALRPFMKKYPKVHVHCRDGAYPSIAPALRSGEIDFALTPARDAERESDFTVVPLVTSDAVIVARKGHPLIGLRSVAELQEARWAYATPSGGPGAVIEEVFVEAGLVPPRPVMICESLFALPDIVANTDVLAALPGRLLTNLRGADQLGIIRIREPLPPIQMVLLQMRDVPLTPAAKELISWLHEAARRYMPSSGS